MAWFKVTDTMMGDQKVLAIPVKMRAEALGVWLGCGVWCAQQLTDGRVPSAVVTQMFGSTKAPEALVKAGLWRATKTGYTFVNWAKYQPLRADIEDKRRANAERVQRWRERHAGNAVTDALVTPPPTRPDPSRPVHISNSPLGGNLRKQGRGSAPPNPCGREHDPADACGACGAARKEAADAEKAEARETARRQREAQRAESAQRRAEAEATVRATPEEAAAAIETALRDIRSKGSAA